MKYFKVSISRGRYNRAFEGYRDKWLKANISTIMVVIVLIVIAAITLRILIKKGKLKFLGKGGA